MKQQYDVIIAGTGAAGLYAALQFDRDVSVLLISKRELPLSNSSLAQGGVAAVLDQGHDNFKLHIADTLIAGKYKNNLAAIEVLVTEGPKDVLRLSYFCKPFMSAKRVKELAELMTVTELIDFRGRLEKQAAENEEVYKAERESFITVPIGDPAFGCGMTVTYQVRKH